jgi:hypothetical protein
MYYIGLGLSLLISLLVVVYLRKPLFRLLVDLCETEDRARFWVQITNLSFLLGSIFMALTYRPHEARAVHYYLASILSRTLFGLLAVTAFLTVIISIFVGRQNRPKIKAGQKS